MSLEAPLSQWLTAFFSREPHGCVHAKRPRSLYRAYTFLKPFGNQPKKRRMPEARAKKNDLTKLLPLLPLVAGPQLQGSTRKGTTGPSQELGPSQTIGLDRRKPSLSKGRPR